MDYCVVVVLGGGGLWVVGGVLLFSFFLVLKLIMSRFLPTVMNRKCSSIGAISGALLCIYLTFVVVGIKQRFRVSGDY